MMLHRFLNVCCLPRETEENKESWIFTNSKLQGNWDSTCFNRLESSLGGKGSLEKHRKPLKSQRQRDESSDCTSLQSPLAGWQHFSPTEIARQGKIWLSKEAFKYSLGIEHSEEKSFVHILNNSSASRQRREDSHPVENYTETLNWNFFSSLLGWKPLLTLSSCRIEHFWYQIRQASGCSRVPQAGHTGVNRDVLKPLGEEEQFLSLH